MDCFFSGLELNNSNPIVSLKVIYTVSTAVVLKAETATYWPRGIFRYVYYFPPTISALSPLFLLEIHGK